MAEVFRRFKYMSNDDLELLVQAAQKRLSMPFTSSVYSFGVHDDTLSNVTQTLVALREEQKLRLEDAISDVTESNSRD